MRSLKLAIIAALAAVSISSPAFTQAFDAREGTGNVLPFSYGPDGAKQRWTAVPQTNQVPQIGRPLYNYAGPQLKQSTTHKRG